MSGASTRGQIIETADRLFYEQGFDHTSFADIAEAVHISRGNFYHHFKSKDEILQAVIAQRLANTREILRQWEEEAQTPAERIKCYIRILLTNGPKIMLHGCPVGTLTSELAKLEHGALGAAGEIFTLFRTWLRDQFKTLGFGNDADALALHILAWSQGVATLYTAFQDQDFVDREVAQICAWLDEKIEVAAQH